MNRKKKVDITLDCIDNDASANVNWNIVKVWRKALEKGLEKIE